MTKIKMCGLMTVQDIEAANAVHPDYIGFVFWPGSRRFLPSQKAAELRRLLDPSIRAVGVFVNEVPETIAELLDRDIIDIVQLHGKEDENDIRKLRALTEKPLIQAFRLNGPQDLKRAESSTADRILLDSGAGSGKVFDWNLIRDIRRPYFLAGGLHPDNVAEAVRTLHPYAVDVSSGIETDRKKDRQKMAAFAAAVRKETIS